MRTPIAALLLVAAAAPALAQEPAAPAAPATLTLEQALGEAEKANADLLRARADVTLAEADRTTARAAVLPRLDLSAAAGRSFAGATRGRSVIDPVTGQPVLVGGSDATNVGSYSADLTASQVLFDWSAFKDLDAANHGKRQGERLYDEAALTVSFDVTQRFYALLRAERSLAVLQQTADRSRELVDRAEALFSAGRSPKSDTLTARVNLQNDLINVEAQRVRVAQARTSLAQALGRTGAEELSAAPPPGLDAATLTASAPPPLDQLQARARERRPTLAAGEEALAASRSSISSAKGGYLPALTARGTYGRSGQDLSGVEGVLGDPTKAYSASVGVALSWNLFEGMRTRSQVTRAEGNLARNQALQQASVEAVAKEVADARASVVSLAAQVTLSEEALRLSRSALDLATQRFAAGLASQLEIRDANLKLAQAELALVQSRIDFAVASADLVRAVGGAL
ncbi:MAG: TolC family protein [Anaeromyxobacter sp.]